MSIDLVRTNYPETTSHQAVSPFDSTRRTRADGTEYWSARDLMSLLGYEKWERLSDAIERAKVAAHNLEPAQTGVFPGAGKKSSTKNFHLVTVASDGGRPGLDYELSRYASYLVAMNGDPRKPQIAAAQAYFAIQTRRAELGDHGALDKYREATAAIELVKEASALLGETEARRRVEQILDHAIGAPAQQVNTAAASNPSRATVGGFWDTHRSQFAWDLLPMVFLYELYRAWLIQGDPTSAPLGRNTFIGALRRHIGASQADWYCVSRNQQVRATDRMNATEPLLNQLDQQIALRIGRQTHWGPVLRRR